jgi:hypothetical protein
MEYKINFDFILYPTPKSSYTKNNYANNLLMVPAYPKSKKPPGPKIDFKNA